VGITKHLSNPHQGLTLPVWVAAAARAATQVLCGQHAENPQSLQIPGQEQTLGVPVQSAAPLQGGAKALAISRCDPGPGLDLTRDLEIWVQALWIQEEAGWLKIVPGEGIGTLGRDGDVCASDFARRLLEVNLRHLVPPGRCLQLEVVFPLGRELAQRTSNAAFGVVDGLALIGTQAEVQSSASPDQLRASLDALQVMTTASDFCGSLTLVIGENGLDLAHQLGIADQQPLLKAGNWIGPLLVASAESGVNNLLLLGYHGKLVKLAGGIFHTHHHLADGRLEVLAAIALQQGLGVDLIQDLLGAASMEEALQELQRRDWAQANRVWEAIAQAVEVRSEAYLKRYGTWSMRVGAALFDRQRHLRWFGCTGHSLIARCGLGIHSEGKEGGFDPSLR
tara:strand:+ start:7453 stop:8634 length:1182 start_codon:yes stop_codon:yes gene_type:complete